MTQDIIIEKRRGKRDIIFINIVLLTGELVGYWNVSRLLASVVITAGEFDDAPVVRTWALCLKFQVLSLVLRPRFNATILHGTLKGTRGGHRIEVGVLPLII